MKEELKFKGIINDTEYDDFESYKKALQEIIKSDTPYSTSFTNSRRYVTDAADFDMLPGFDVKSIQNSKYLDYIDNNLTQNPFIEDDIRNHFKWLYDNIASRIEKMPEAERAAYKDAVHEVLEYLAGNGEAREKALDLANRFVERRKKEIKSHNEFSKLYNKINDLLDDKSKIEIKPKTNRKNQSEDIINSLSKLWDAWFNF